MKKLMSVAATFIAVVLGILFLTLVITLALPDMPMCSCCFE